MTDGHDTYAIVLQGLHVGIVAAHEALVEREHGGGQRNADADVCEQRESGCPIAAQARDGGGGGLCVLFSGGVAVTEVR